MWDNLWSTIFGTTELFGIDISFWIGMGLCALVVIAMYIVYWGIMKSKQDTETPDKAAGSTMDTSSPD